jgi:membrane associated rhomboid family serine protease
MNNSTLVWIRFGTGQPFKVSIADCQDVADLIEAARNKLALSDRLDELYLFVIDTDGEQQRPGKLITQVLDENYPAGRNDQYPLLIRKVSQSRWQAGPWSIWQNSTFQKIISVLHSEWNSTNWFTIAIVASCFWDLESCRLYSATFLFIILQIGTFAFLNSDSLLTRKHFTCSWDNLLHKRYWTLVSSSLAHADINHLLCNISALASNGPLFESFVGFRVALLFYCMASAVSGLISLNVHGRPSIGSSGVIFAIVGFLIPMVDFDWHFYIVDNVLYYLAITDNGVNHASHAGGFLFGYFIRDTALHQANSFKQHSQFI